jgi:hypothetical protein
LPEQKVEANTLTLFSGPDGALASLLRTHSVLVPQLIHHDEESYVLIIEDLGRLPPLSEYFVPLPPSEDNSRLGQLFSNEPFCRSIGRRLGNFLADLHSKSTLDAVIRCRSGNGEDGLTSFQNSNLKEVVRDAAVLPIKGYLDKFNVPDAEKLYRIVQQDFEREYVDGERCFIVGDLWPGGILIGDLESDSAVPKLGVIDWEFSGPGRGVNGDMAQLFAHLQLQLIASEFHRRGSAHHAGTAALIESTSASYHAQSKANRAPWACQPSSPSEPPPSSSPATQIFRSALILHGRELINNSIEADWSHFCDGYGNSRKEDLVRSMVNAGVWYLRAARSNEVEFAEVENWSNVCADAEGKAMVALLLGRSHLFCSPSAV